MDRYTFLISGFFGFGDIELPDVLNHLAIAAGKPLTIKVSSVGGDVQTGVSIRNAIDQYAQANGVDVEFEVIGWAQSTASYLTTLPNAKVVVSPDSLYMIHNPRADAFGDYNDLEKRLGWLKPVTESFRTAYAQKSGMDATAVAKALDDETFYMGQEIIDAGFADELRQGSSVTASAGDKQFLLEQSRKEFERFKAAAMGGRENKKSVETRKDEASMPDKSNNAADETKAAVAKAESRARAYAVALGELPVEMHGSIKKAYDDGKDEAFFNGMVAHAKAVVDTETRQTEKEKHEIAQAEGVGDLGGDNQELKPATIGFIREVK